MNNTEYVERLKEHYAKTWPIYVGATRWEKGPIRDLPDEFDVVHFRRASGLDICATRCMSLPSDAERLELHVISRGVQEPAGLVELLTTIAHFHRTGQRLSLGHTVSFGRPWLPKSRCAYGLISLPYLDGPRLEWMEDPRVRCLWLVPITVEEREFKKTAGLEALEERLEKEKFDFADPGRKSVV